jgi:hypothetical protein
MGFDGPRHCLSCRSDLSAVEPGADGAGVCPTCGRAFDPADPETTTVHDAAWCRGCGYDVTGLDAGRCPECGQAFDPADLTSVAPERPKPMMQRLVTRASLVRIAVVLALLAGMWTTVIPRPGLRSNGSVAWSVWLWLGEAYGREELTPPPYKRLATYHAGRTVGIEAWRPRGNAATGWWDPKSGGATVTPTEMAYRIERLDESTWRLEVAVADVDFGDVLRDFNYTRRADEYFGISIMHADPRARRMNDAPFRVQGTDVDVLNALIDAYGLRVEPWLTPDEDGLVWVTNDEGGLARISVEEARARGFDLPMLNPAQIPRHAPDAE